MAQAIVDPEHLRHFAGELTRLTGEVRDQMLAIRGLFAWLEETWRDQEQAKFAEKFEETLAVLEEFRRHTEDHHVPFLQRKAEAAQHYLDRA